MFSTFELFLVAEVSSVFTNVERSRYTNTYWSRFDGSSDYEESFGERKLTWTLIEHGKLEDWNPGYQTASWPPHRAAAASWKNAADDQLMIFGGFRSMQSGMADLWRFSTTEERWDFLGGTSSARALPEGDLIAEQLAAAADDRSWPMPRGQASVSMLPDGSGGYIFGGSVQIQTTDPQQDAAQGPMQHPTPHPLPHGTNTCLHSRPPLADKNRMCVPCLSVAAL